MTIGRNSIWRFAGKKLNLETRKRVGRTHGFGLICLEIIFQVDVILRIFFGLKIDTETTQSAADCVRQSLGLSARMMDAEVESSNVTQDACRPTKPSGEENGCCLS